MAKKQYNQQTDGNPTDAVSEPAGAYTANVTEVYMPHANSISDKHKEYLKDNLDSQSFKELEEVNFMIGQPFPANETGANWIEEAELAGDSDAVQEHIVRQAISTWTNIR